MKTPASYQPPKTPWIQRCLILVMLVLSLLGSGLVWHAPPVMAVPSTTPVVRKDRRADRERPTVASPRTGGATGRGQRR